MKSSLPILLVIFCTLISKGLSTSDDYFLSVARAILQNKNTLFDSSSSSTNFATWQGSAFDQQNTFGFTQNQGLVIENWEKDYESDPNLVFSLSLRLLDGAYTDQKGVLINIIVNEYTNAFTLNRSNGTVIVNSLNIEFQDQQTKASQNYQGDVSIYFVEKTTKQPPETFDTSNLQAYTAQFIIKIQNSSLEFSTTLLDDRYPITLQNILLLLIGSVVYFGISVASMHTSRAYEDRRIHVSHLALFFLLLFPVYTICYISVWFTKITFVLTILPLTLVMFFSFIKHIIEMVNNGTNGCLLVCFYPLPMLALAFFPQVGLYIGDLLSCLYLLPQVIEKFMRRNRREKWLTRFEIGNWTCISLWVYYMDLYPHNVFLTSPKPIVVIIYSVAILLQLGVLIYLEIKYKAFAAQHEPDDQPAVQPAQIPRKITDIFRRYTVSMKDSKVRRKLVSDQCAICIEDFEVQSKEKLYKAPCGHFFHAECLKSWGKKQLDCPVCRAQLPAFG